MELTSNITTDHHVIREWIETRGGSPAVCTSLARGGGELRVAFSDTEEPLSRISWKAFFELFEDDRLAFQYDAVIEGDIECDMYRFIPRSEPRAHARLEEAHHYVYDCYSTA